MRLLKHLVLVFVRSYLRDPARRTTESAVACLAEESCSGQLLGAFIIVNYHLADEVSKLRSDLGISDLQRLFPSLRKAYVVVEGKISRKLKQYASCLDIS